MANPGRAAVGPTFPSEDANTAVAAGHQAAAASAATAAGEPTTAERAAAAEAAAAAAGEGAGVAALVRLLVMKPVLNAPMW